MSKGKKRGKFFDNKRIEKLNAEEMFRSRSHRYLKNEYFQNEVLSRKKVGRKSRYDLDVAIMKQYDKVFADNLDMYRE